jgi:hypothetical protein
MKLKFLLVLISLGFTSIYGCSSVPVAKNAAKINLSFAWPKSAACNSNSPAMTLSNIPKETAFLEFKMRDFQATFNHGGGVIPYNGSNSIPEGALKDYSGPCPPSPHTYEISVKALNPNKDLILGEGAFSRQFPENQ